VRRAATAPSAGNAQPWRFVWSGRALELHLERSRGGTFLDVDYRSSYLALGCAAEALVHAASAAGREIELRSFPTGQHDDLCYRVELGPRSSVLEPSRLAAVLESRCTNRRMGTRHPLLPEHADALLETARSGGTELRLVTAPEALDEIGAVLGEVDRIRFLCETLHRDLMSELRFSEAEARTAGDGIDVATLELDPVGRAALGLLRDPAACALLRKLGKGDRLTSGSRRAVAAASAVGLLTAEGTGPQTFLEGGRTVERIWLTATTLGMSLQPMSVAPYLFAKLDRDGGATFTTDELSSLSRLRDRLWSVLPVPAGHVALLLFRIFRADAPGTRSLRRGVEEILVWG
jgi:hypothetical protein